MVVGEKIAQVASGRTMNDLQEEYEKYLDANDPTEKNVYLIIKADVAHVISTREDRRAAVELIRKQSTKRAKDITTALQSRRPGQRMSPASAVAPKSSR